MFDLRKIENARINVPEPEMLAPTASETFKEGEALYISSGKATKASGTNKPTHICMESYVAPSTGARKIATYRITPEMLFEVPVDFSSSPVALVEGSKVTVGSDGLGVTDVTTSGVVTIVDTLEADNTDGDKILIRIE